ncbi:spindle assembly checkpoint component Mad1 [Coprinopsis sp. MPI-PUGE-AT-0042]|nr:spindle assembly checkpoint component Mad1 [Coprinopsis sp. MPI-PUGE-AT-0042]
MNTNGDSNNFQTPLAKLRFDPKSSRSTATKRDSLAAELERDPQLSTAKRLQRTQVFNSSLSHANLERQLLAAQTTTSELETKLREKELLIERLERDRRYFADREKEEREEKEREREVYDQAKRKTDTDIRTLRTSLTALREEFADLQDTHSALSRSTSQTIASQKSQLTTLNHRVELLEHELSQSQQTADERSRILANLQAQYDELVSQQDGLMHYEAEQEGMGVVREELHRQAEYLRTLEAKNVKLTSELSYLRERNQSIEVLMEEKRGLETKLVGLDELKEKVIRLEAEVEAGRLEREAWASKTQDTNNNSNSTPSSVPIFITQALTDLRLTHAQLLEEHGATTASLRQRTAELISLESQNAQHQKLIQALEAEVRAAKEELRRKDSKVMLVEREVGYLQALLASFKAEEAYGENKDATPAVDQVKLNKMDQLEALLAEYKNVNDQLANDLEALEGPMVSTEELEKVEQEKKALRQTISEYEQEIASQATKIDELEQALFDLSGEIAGGRHVPPKTRVLCMAENPDQAWVDLRQATMDRIKGENEALIKRLKELEESGVSTAGSEGQRNEELVPRASWEQVNKEKEDLQNELKQKEKRLLRLQQVFQSKSAEFREAIASILGLKLAFYPNGQVRVTSMYDLNASFIFQPASKEQGARMQLVAQGEGGPQDLPSLMKYWIETEQCTAGFLASVTLECYDNWKRGGGDEEEGAV